ncbi:hypothetical protein [Thalassotalea aquiviva]
MKPKHLLDEQKQANDLIVVLLIFGVSCSVNTRDLLTKARQ